jgi:hypothetical protein
VPELPHAQVDDGEQAEQDRTQVLGAAGVKQGEDLLELAARVVPATVCDVEHEPTDGGVQGFVRVTECVGLSPGTLAFTTLGAYRATGPVPPGPPRVPRELSQGALALRRW